MLFENCLVPAGSRCERSPGVSNYWDLKRKQQGSGEPREDGFSDARGGWLGLGDLCATGLCTLMPGPCCLPSGFRKVWQESRKAKSIVSLFHSTHGVTFGRQGKQESRSNSFLDILLINKAGESKSYKYVLPTKGEKIQPFNMLVFLELALMQSSCSPLP